MWELAQAHQGNPAMVEKYLSDGYEPFAVCTDVHSFPIIWLRREVVDVEPVIIEEEDEIPDKPEPKPRASRRVTKKTEG